MAVVDRLRRSLDDCHAVEWARLTARLCGWIRGRLSRCRSLCLSARSRRLLRLSRGRRHAHRRSQQHRQTNPRPTDFHACSPFRCRFPALVTSLAGAASRDSRTSPGCAQSGIHRDPPVPLRYRLTTATSGTMFRAKARPKSGAFWGGAPWRRFQLQAILQVVSNSRARDSRFWPQPCCSRFPLAFSSRRILRRASRPSILPPAKSVTRSQRVERISISHTFPPCSSPTIRTITRPPSSLRRRTRLCSKCRP